MFGNKVFLNFWYSGILIKEKNLWNNKNLWLWKTFWLRQAFIWYRADLIEKPFDWKSSFDPEKNLFTPKTPETVSFWGFLWFWFKKKPFSGSIVFRIFAILIRKAFIWYGADLIGKPLIPKKPFDCKKSSFEKVFWFDIAWFFLKIEWVQLYYLIAASNSLNWVDFWLINWH